MAFSGYFTVFPGIGSNTWRKSFIKQSWIVLKQSYLKSVFSTNDILVLKCRLHFAPLGLSPRGSGKAKKDRTVALMANYEMGITHYFSGLYSARGLCIISKHKTFPLHILTDVSFSIFCPVTWAGLLSPASSALLCPSCSHTRSPRRALWPRVVNLWATASFHTLTTTNKFNRWINVINIKE